MWTGTPPAPSTRARRWLREAWTNLNGPWKFAFGGETRPRRSTARSPCPSRSSRTCRASWSASPEGATLWYAKGFARPAGERVVLHFEAVDWSCRVWVDGTEVGAHEGGYDPFAFDVTSALEGEGEHEVVVAVTDPTNRDVQPRGKQVEKPEGIYYVPSPASGGRSGSRASRRPP